MIRYFKNGSHVSNGQKAMVVRLEYTTFKKHQGEIPCEWMDPESGKPVILWIDARDLSLIGN